MRAPTRECPECHQRVHVRKKSCDCGHNFPAYGSGSPTKVDAPIDKPAQHVIIPPVDVPPTSDEQQAYYRRVRTLEASRAEDNRKLNFLVSLNREMLKVLRAFNQVPASLALMLEGDKWYGMNEEREVRPVNIAEPEISFALGDDTTEVKAAPWEDDVFTS